MTVGSSTEQTLLRAPRAFSSEEALQPAARRGSRQRPPEGVDTAVCVIRRARKSYMWPGQLVNRTEMFGMQHSPRIGEGLREGAWR